MITFDGIRKAFGARHVLDGVTVNVAAARVTALVGPNGSGKTTLIKILLGLTHPDAGVISIGGTPVDVTGSYRSQVGYMPQAANFPSHLRVGEIVELVTALRGGQARDESLLDAFGLRADWDRPVGTLSGGTRQKLNASIAMMFAPSVLVLDEPTAGLDPVAAATLRDRVRRERDRGRAVLITSHVLSELEELADDVTFICDGTVRFAGSIAQLREATGESRVEPAIVSLMRSVRRADPVSDSAVAPGVATEPG
ncbi:MAG: ABC transporter ATP-binding protein [Gemmatimonadetes bacterium]|nr:ABC transporter ATP-binding protein [Gemmatimonadota bacterium]